MMKALICRIAFFEALFKSHYTKGFRLSYLIPLPTSVAGMFGAMLGIPRTDVGREFKDFMFGAVIIKHKGIVRENVTFLQNKAGKTVKGVAKTFIINEPDYVIAMAGDSIKLENFRIRLDEKLCYLPYGGQNDFFPRDYRIFKDLEEVEDSNLVRNYAPSDWVESLKTNGVSELQILPVMHKFQTSPSFHFIANGELLLCKSIPCVARRGIGLYYLRDFYSVGEGADA